MRISSGAEFVDYFEGIRARTRRVVDCIPRESFGWAPGPGRWSFADLVRHLAATERWMFAENVAGRPSRYPGHGSDLAEGPQAVVDYLDTMHREAMEIVAPLDAAQLERKCDTPAGVPITAWKWLRAMVEHEVHHRGQLYLMLGLLDVATPPLYGLTSEQVRQRSLPAEPAPGDR